jgi:PAS domain S-box-containing protein
VLDLPVTALALERDGELTVVAATEKAAELFATLPSFNGEDGLTRHTFETGRPTVVADAREHPESASDESPVRSVGIFPLGEHGVLITGSTEPDVLDETDADFGTLLAASVESALDRADRERELRERSDELAQITQTLEAMIEAVPVPIVALDEQQRVELWNPAAEEVFGWDAEAVVDAPAPIVPPERREQFEELLRMVLAGETVESEEVVRRTKDGERLEFQLSTAPLRDADGAIRGSLGVFLDISEHKAHERRLSALHETTRELMHASDRNQIATIASEAMTDVLDHPVNAVRYVDEEQASLEVAATPEEPNEAGVQIEERLACDVEDSDAGIAYREGRTVQSTGAIDGETYHRLYVPLGDHGVLTLGSAD